jgi:hypothetical protein
VARNATDVRVSRGFAASLEARLAAERGTSPRVAARHRLPTKRAIGALAASLLAMAWLADHRPAAGLPAATVARLSTPPELPPPLPQPVVRSSPLRNSGAVRVVSISPGTAASWSPLPGNMPEAIYAPTLVSASYTPLATR